MWRQSAQTQNKSVEFSRDHPQHQQIAEHQNDGWNHSSTNMKCAVTFNEKRKDDRRISLVGSNSIFPYVHFCFWRQQFPLIVLLRGCWQQLNLVDVVVHLFASLHPGSKSEGTILTIKRPVRVISDITMSSVLTWHDTSNATSRKNQTINVWLTLTNVHRDMRIV